MPSSIGAILFGASWGLWLCCTESRRHGSRAEAPAALQTLLVQLLRFFVQGAATQPPPELVHAAQRDLRIVAELSSEVGQAKAKQSQQAVRLGSSMHHPAHIVRHPQNPDVASRIHFAAAIVFSKVDPALLSRVWVKDNLLGEVRPKAC